MKGFPRPSHICVTLLFLVSQVLSCLLFVLVIWWVIEISIYNQCLCFRKQMCVFLCLQWSLVVATITEIPPLVFLPNFLVQRKVLRPLRTQTGGTIMVGPSENLTHTAEQNDFKTFRYFRLCFKAVLSSSAQG